jgi:hypothetical protein
MTPERIDLGAAEDRSVARSLPLRNVCGSALREHSCSSSASQTSWLLDAALQALALAEKRLFGVQRENIGLRKNNAHLMDALNGASRRVVAAVRLTPVGLAVYPQDGKGHDRLLQHADAAMFRDKAELRAGRRLCEMADNSGAASQERPTETRAAG